MRDKPEMKSYLQMGGFSKIAFNSEVYFYARKKKTPMFCERKIQWKWTEGGPGMYRKRLGAECSTTNPECRCRGPLGPGEVQGNREGTVGPLVNRMRTLGPRGEGFDGGRG